MTSIYRDANLVDKRLRRKDDTTADDPDWYTGQWDPTSFLCTVASAAAGTLTIQINPVDASKPTPSPIAITLIAETAAQAAEAMEVEVESHLSSVDDNADFDRNLGTYIKRAEYTAAATSLRIVPQPGAPKFTVTLTPTGGAMTFTLSPDDVFPITGWSAKQHGVNVGAPGEVAITVHAVTTADEMLGVGTCTYDMQVMRVAERYDPVADEERRPGVGDLGTLTGLALGEEVRVPSGGGRIGVRLTNIANVPSTTDALEVRYRDAVT